eukprot:Phypoly_transcript_11014.p1 GENE.Phypoly_transcript_11014~~Phypoly_transcript_11014.p1  ORF type:complete len:341 (+),score=49.43 Phypoly_transcript_11014:164-1186(+)
MDNLHSYFLVFLILSLLYGAVMVVWGVNWYKHRSSSGILLHRYVGFTLVLQCIQMLMLSIYYPVRWHEDASGEYGYTKSYYFAMAFYVSACLAQAVFYSMLIIIAMGWCIIETTLSTLRILGLTVFVFAYFTVEFVKIQSENDMSTFVTMIYLELGLFIGMLIYVIIKTQYNIRRLSLQVKDGASDPHATTDPSAPPSSASIPLSEIPPKSSSSPSPPSSPVFSLDEEDGGESGERREETRGETGGEGEGDSGEERGRESAGPRVDEMTIPEAREKLKLFQYFYKLFAVYMVLLVFIKYFSTTAIAVISGMYLDFIFLVGICYVFRLRNANQYFYLVNEE